MVIKTLSAFKDEVSRNLLANLDDKNRSRASHLKVQMIETNTNVIPDIPGYTQWVSFDDTPHWMYCLNDESMIVVNRYSDTVWAVYTLMKVSNFSNTVYPWIKNTVDLDRCWIPAGYMEGICRENRWEERGIGVKFSDEFNDEDNHCPVSIKGWYGRNETVDRALNILKNEFAISSMRFKDRESSMISEWYSSGKITFNACDDVDLIIDSVNQMLSKYSGDLRYARELRDSEHGSFELTFTQPIDMEKFSEIVRKGSTNLRLWMTETETHDDFRRFRGIDMHTWDRVFLDLGENYAYLTVPGKGCVNAAPRMMTLQGESIGGKTKVFYNGSQLFV